jgi:hypothetical protein
LNKIVCSVMESYFFIPQNFSRFFSAFPQTPAAHLRALRSHQCAAAHRLKIARLRDC